MKFYKLYECYADNTRVLIQFSDSLEYIERIKDRHEEKAPKSFSYLIE